MITKRLVIRIIRGYRSLSRLTPRTCRYYPTCSEYAMESVEKYGVFSGIGKAFRRILRCHPWHPGGYDPV